MFFDIHFVIITLIQQLFPVMAHLFQFVMSCFLHHLCNPVSALTDCQRARQITFYFRIDLHGNRHGQKHSMMLLFQKFSDFPGSSLCEQAPLIQHVYFVCPGNHILQTMLCEDYSCTNIPVDLPHSFQKVRGSNRIQLRRRFIQNQKFWMHGHNRCQIQ